MEVRLLDQIDQQLIKLLQRNSRQSTKALASQLHTSRPTVSRRLNRLLRNGIVHATLVVDNEKIGCPLLVMIALAVLPHSLNDVSKRLFGHPSIRWLSNSVGRFNILVLAQFPSTAQFFELVQELTRKPSPVKDYEALVCTRTYRRWRTDAAQDTGEVSVSSGQA